MDARGQQSAYVHNRHLHDRNHDNNHFDYDCVGERQDKQGVTCPLHLLVVLRVVAQHRIGAVVQTGSSKI